MGANRLGGLVLPDACRYAGMSNKTNCEIGPLADQPWHSKPARRAISIMLSASRKGRLRFWSTPQH